MVFAQCMRAGLHWAAGRCLYRAVLMVVAFGLLIESGYAQSLLTNGKNHSGSIAVIGEVDAWTFQAPVGAGISISAAEVLDYGGFAPRVQLLDAEGSVVAFGVGPLVGMADLVSAARGGSYTVLVSSGDAAGTGRGEYQLTLATSPGSFVVPSDDEGGEMINGENVVGTIVLGDLDQWTFNASTGDAISLSIGQINDNGGLSPWIRLRAPDGTQLATDAGPLVGHVDILSAPQSGLYTVVVASGDTAHTGTGTYSLTLAQTPGAFIVSSGDEGGAIVNGANHLGAIALGDLDLWSFTADAGNSMSISLAELTDNGGFTPWIRLRGPDGTQVASVLATQVAQVDIGAAPQTGLYTILVGSGDSARSGTGTYRITVARSPGSFVVASGDDGGSLTNGANHVGGILPGDLDMWAFQAAAGDAISLSIGELTDTFGGFTPWIRLRAPDGSQVSNGSGPLVGHIDVLSASQTGTYTVLVSSGDTARIGSGNYRLTLAQTPGAFTVPADDEGGPLTAGSNNHGTIHLGDLDQWTFDAAAGDPIAIAITELSDAGSFTPWIRLRAPNGTQLGSSLGATSGAISLPSAPQSGTYTVLAGSGDTARIGSGTYAITSSHASLSKRPRGQLISN